MRSIILMCVAIATACGNAADWNAPGVVSPDGSAKARVVEYEAAGVVSSQVYIAFDKGRCGAGSVSAPGVGLDIRLSWLGEHSLVVSVPENLDLKPAPGSRTLNYRVQCRNRRVNVVVNRH